eukprot:gene3632-6211_t
MKRIFRSAEPASTKSKDTDSLREILVSFLTLSNASDSAIKLVRNYALYVDVSGKQLANQMEQNKLLDLVPLLLAVATSAHDSKARAAAFRAMGNGLVHADKNPDAVQLVHCTRQHGFIEAASHALAINKFSTVDKAVRREASRLINNLAYFKEMQTYLLRGSIVHILLKHISFMGSDAEETEVIGMCTGALSHMCFFNENKKELLASGVVDGLLPIASSDNPKHKPVRASIGIASLVGDEENHPALKVTSDVIENSTECLKAALTGQSFPPGSNTYNHPENASYKIHACHNVLNGIHSLAGNEDNKLLLQQSGVLDIVVDLLEQEDLKDGLRDLALKIIRRLSFNEHNVNILRNRQGFKALMHRMKQHNDKNVRKQADGILWQLEDHVISCKEEIPFQNDLHSGKQVMLSYCWNEQDLVLQTRNFLKARGVSTWMDVAEMSGSTLEAMSRAVETSHTIIIFFSKGYKDSANCRTEAEYAYQLKKEIIPVRVDSYQPDGWLGAILGTKLWFDIQDPMIRDMALERLLRELGVILNITHTISRQSNQFGEAKTDNKTDIFSAGRHFRLQMNHIQAVTNWSTHEVATWLNDNNCSLLATSLPELNGDGLAAFMTSLAMDGPLRGLNSILQIVGCKPCDAQWVAIANKLFLYAITPQ